MLADITATITILLCLHVGNMPRKFKLEKRKVKKAELDIGNGSSPESYSFAKLQQDLVDSNSRIHHGVYSYV